jgi:hypothetical protein
MSVLGKTYGTFHVRMVIECKDANKEAKSVSEFDVYSQCRNITLKDQAWGVPM